MGFHGISEWLNGDFMGFHSDFQGNLGWYYTYSSEKYEFVNWDDYWLFTTENKIHVPVTTKQFLVWRPGGPFQDLYREEISNWKTKPWLVVESYTSEKYESSGMIIPNISGKIKVMFQTTIQIIYG